MANQRRHPRLEGEILHLAARLLAEGAAVGPGNALRKAAERLGASPRALPSYKDLAIALSDYQRLFVPEHGGRIAALRRHALHAMQFLAAFRPLLVGPVLAGTATAADPITLHLFVEPQEDLALLLLENGIPFVLGEQRLRMDRDTQHLVPCLRCTADGEDFELLCLPLALEHQPPLCPVDGRPMKRLGERAVAALLAPAPSPDPPAE
jgi:hypothetical protein